jgi:hypothetical protein
MKAARSCRKPMQGSPNIQRLDPAASASNGAPCTSGIVVAEPLLGDLSEQGGATKTIPHQAGSPAIDAGEGCSDPDQRGQPRNGVFDLGAFEEH